MLGQSLIPLMVTIYLTLGYHGANACDHVHEL